MPHLAGSSRLLRAMNESAALAHLLEHGQLTRAKLHELTGLSKPTISEAPCSPRCVAEPGCVAELAAPLSPAGPPRG